MATIIQGEQYAVEFVLTNGDESITPSNAVGLTSGSQFGNHNFWRKEK